MQQGPYQQWQLSMADAFHSARKREWPRMRSLAQFACSHSALSARHSVPLL